jgi:hypothetical protein
MRLTVNEHLNSHLSACRHSGGRHLHGIPCSSLCVSPLTACSAALVTLPSRSVRIGSASREFGWLTPQIPFPLLIDVLLDLADISISTRREYNVTCTAEKMSNGYTRCSSLPHSMTANLNPSLPTAASALCPLKLAILNGPTDAVNAVGSQRHGRRYKLQQESISRSFSPPKGGLDGVSMSKMAHNCLQPSRSRGVCPSKAFCEGHSSGCLRTCHRRGFWRGGSEGKCVIPASMAREFQSPRLANPTLPA